MQNNFPHNISTFGEAQDGTLYAMTLSPAAMYKVVIAASLPVTLISFNALHDNGRDVLKWKATIDPALAGYSVERSTDGRRFLSVGNVDPVTTGLDASYQFNTNDTIGSRYYRLKMNYNNGFVQYSSVITLDDRAPIGSVSVRYIGAKQIQLTTPYTLKHLNIINGYGSVVKQLTDIPAGSQIINMEGIQTGVYWLQCVSNKTENIKIVNQ